MYLLWVSLQETMLAEKAQHRSEYKTAEKEYTHIHMNSYNTDCLWKDTQNPETIAAEGDRLENWGGAGVEGKLLVIVYFLVLFLF